MTILDRHLGKNILLALAKVLVSLILLFILIDLLTQRQEDISRYEIPWSMAALYYATYASQIFFEFQIAALAMLVASLLVLGNAAQRNEILAALAGGVSLRRIIRIPVLIAAVYTVAVLAAQETLGVTASQWREDLEERYFAHNTQTKRPGVSWAQLEGDWTCHIMKLNRVALTGESVFMHSIRGDAVEQIQAKRIFWDEQAGEWILEDGLWFVFDPEEGWQYENFRITQRPAPIHETPEELFALDHAPDAKDFVTLAADIRRAASHGIPVGKHWTEFHAKFAQPALCFVMVWLAIPFALRLRKGGIAMSVGLSIAVGLVYLLVFRATMGMGHLEHLPPVVAAWVANAAFLAMGVALFRRTPT